ETGLSRGYKEETMLDSPRQFFTVIAAVAVAVTADIASTDSGHRALASEAVGEAIVAAPGSITGIQPPAVGQLASLEDTRLRAPDLEAPLLSAPPVPNLDLTVWGAEGVIPAPTAVIEVEAPDLDDLPSLEDPATRGYGLQPPAPTIGQ
ncbi:MAG: hypothetical protein ABFS14_11005, partial [Gemmatimonadota bacterium]